MHDWITYLRRLSAPLLSEESIASFVEMFQHGAPRFISPNAPPYESESPEALELYSSIPDPSAHQLDLFLSTVKPQLSNSTLRSFLRLYTTLGTDKLAGFLQVDEETVLEMLMTAKGAARKFTWTQGSLLEGEIVGVSDINFGIDEVSLWFPFLSSSSSFSVPSYVCFFFYFRLTFRSLNRRLLDDTVTSSSVILQSSEMFTTTFELSPCVSCFCLLSPLELVPLLTVHFIDHRSRSCPKKGTGVDDRWTGKGDWRGREQAGCVGQWSQGMKR